LGFQWTLLAGVLFELGLLITIRDNLFLNVVMLVWPIESIKNWQMG
jgi:hypothetical protein